MTNFNFLNILKNSEKIVLHLRKEKFYFQLLLVLKLIYLKTVLLLVEVSELKKR